eukprot:scaffold306064_cov17-Tisochrysis_lutea.AAC.1
MGRGKGPGACAHCPLNVIMGRGWGPWACLKIQGPVWRAVPAGAGAQALLAGAHLGCCAATAAAEP